MPCGRHKCSNFQIEFEHLEEPYAGAHDFIQIESATYGQHQGLVNVTSCLPVRLFQVYLL